MSWTAYDDPEVARKMTAGALAELSRWIGGDHEFHEPWKVFCGFMDYIKTPGYNMSRNFLDVGCAAAYYYPILKLHQGWFWNYQGIERSQPLRELAFSVFGVRAHPSIGDARSHGAMITSNEPIEYHQWQIVLSGSMLQHEEDWGESLAEQIGVCDRWLIIHKIPIADTLVQRQKQAYGVTMNEWNFPVALINEKVGRKPVDEHYFATAEPHWSGLYDLEA